MINNFLDITIVNAAVLPPIPAFGLFTPTVLIFPSRAVGNPLLQQEQMDAIEVGYVGTFGRTTFTASVYRNETTDSVDFFTASVYDSQIPVPGWPLPPIFLDFPPFAGLFPLSFSYRNIGETTDQGVEISLQVRPSAEWSYFLNYSYQDEPEVKGVDRVRLPNGTVRDAVNTPPENRLNAGLAYDGGRFFVNGNVNYAGEAFWTDVLDSRFWGPTEDYTQVNVSAGVRFSGDRVTLSVNAQNVFDEDVLQHVFGDIIGRKVTGQLLFRF